jgi:predicted acetyltransferase
MPFLFSYGSLQDADVQRSTFGRPLDGEHDELPGFEPSLVTIDDPAQAAASGKTHHANVRFNGRTDSRVSGTVFEVTAADLAAADEFERAAAYTRITAMLASGKHAWVYVEASSAPREQTRRRGMMLVWPAREHLPGYIDALERGWSPDNVRGPEAAREQLARITADSDAFLAGLVDKDAVGDPITLADGTTVPRLPGYHRWMWDGEFCGTIGLRWQRGTEALPPYCLGHIGYSVVPWKRRRGYATQALREMLTEAGDVGLRYVEITTDPDNVPSRRVIEANGGMLVEEFVKPAALGGTRGLRYRVVLPAQRNR